MTDGPITIMSLYVGTGIHCRRKILLLSEIMKAHTEITRNMAAFNGGRGRSRDLLSSPIQTSTMKLFIDILRKIRRNFAPFPRKLISFIIFKRQRHEIHRLRILVLAFTLKFNPRTKIKVRHIFSLSVSLFYIPVFLSVICPSTCRLIFRGNELIRKSQSGIRGRGSAPSPKKERKD